MPICSFRNERQQPLPLPPADAAFALAQAVDDRVQYGIELDKLPMRALSPVIAVLL